MNNTHLSYFEDMFLLKQTAKVLAVEQYQDGRSVLILDRTIFYPQGGGQPYDTGVIVKDAAEFRVEEVRNFDGRVFHIGECLKGSFNSGDEVVCEVDQQRRALNSVYHSAGHLIDVVLENLGYVLEPSKGHHFPDGAYDEYNAEISQQDLAVLSEKVQPEIKRLLEIGAPVSAEIMPIEQAKKACRFVPDFLLPGEPARIVSFCFPAAQGGQRSWACGGTHVRDLKDVKGVLVSKIKVKKGKTKVSYSLVS